MGFGSEGVNVDEAADLAIGGYGYDHPQIPTPMQMLDEVIKHLESWRDCAPGQSQIEPLIHRITECQAAELGRYRDFVNAHGKGIV